MTEITDKPYYVQRLDGEEKENCSKHIFKLWRMEDRTEIKTARISFSLWQREDLDEYTDRVRDWAKKLISEDIDKSEIDVDVDSTTV